MPKRRLPSRAEIITTDFIECLNEVKFKNIEDISRDLIRIYPGRRNQHIRERTKDFWDTIISTANLIITLAEFIPFLRNWQKVTREIIEEYQMITNSQKFENIGEFLSSLLVFLNKLQREQKARNANAPVPSPPLFTPNLEVREIEVRNMECFDEQVLESLDHYETTAENIRSDQAYTSSKLHELEILLYDRQSYLNTHIPSTCDIDASLSFVALTAPSMEGKTQSAFVFKKVRPLYFALSTTISNSIPTSRQRIYENYAGVSSALYRYAENDLVEIERLDASIDVLGFLVALVQDSNRPEVIRQSWMRYHSTRSDFTFKPVRISDIKRDFFKGFVLFLDEYKRTEWAIYVRNLARAVGLTCLVANTNTDIVNMAGTGVYCSGGCTTIIWSIIVTRLSPASIDFLDRTYELLKSIEMINRNTTDPGVKLFLQNFIDEQVKLMNPGVSSIMAQSIRDYVKQDHRQINLRSFLDEFLRDVANNLIWRKFLDLTDLIAQSAQVGLLLPESYEKSMYIGHNNWFFRGSDFMNYHLYHLVNPSHTDNCIILTCTPRASMETLQVVESRQLWDWTNERVTFEPKEKTTILACLFLKFGNTITDVLNRFYSEIRSKSIKASNYQPSYPLKISVAISIIESSQHSHYTEVFSLGGQNGIDFMTNLILNQFDEYNFQKYGKKFNLEIVGCKFSLRHYLQHIKVPFLYSLDREDSFFDHLNNISESIYLKKYERIVIEDDFFGECYFKFNFKFNGREKVALVDCKN